MNEYQIECGRHRGLVKAKSLGSAWRKLTKNKKTGFGKLCRFTAPNIPMWQYTTPQAMDRLP